jgi:hypothetical protein
MSTMYTIENTYGHNGIGLLKERYVIEYLQPGSGKKNAGKVNTYLQIHMKIINPLMNCTMCMVKEALSTIELTCKRLDSVMQNEI